MLVAGGSTNVTTYFALRLAADDTAATGLTITGFDLQYVRSGAAPAAKVDATALAATDSAHADNKAIEIDGTDQPGLYRVDWPDAAFAVGVREVILSVKVATAKTKHLRVEIDGSAAAYLGPQGPGVYLDDGAANTGVVLGIDGTARNPVSTIATVNTIAAALGVQVIYLINDTQVTLAQTYEGYTFVGLGLNNKVTLGSQDVDNSEFCNLILTGTQGGTGQIYAHHCSLTALVSAELIAFHCWLTGNNTLRAASTHIFKDCCSAVAGQATSDLTFPGSGTTEVNFRNYSGGLTVKSATANDTMSFDADGQIVIDASCTSLTISVRGNCQITDNGTTTSLTQEAAINLTNINAEADTALSDYDGPTNAEMEARTIAAAAAANLELQYDTTGLVGDTFPASQGQVGQLTVGAGGISAIATSGTTITTGTETLTFASTEELDGTTHDVAAVGGNTDFYYEFDVGSGGIATAFSWWGYPQSNNDTYAVLGYDWVSAGFKQIGTLPGSNGTTITEHTFIPAVNMTGTGANIGLVRLQFTSADGTEIFTDRVLCEFTQAVQGIANGSTVTLSAATTNTNLIGKEWILALGGQNITGSFISGATVTGIATATAEYEFEECDMGAVTLDNDGHFERCALEGTFTVGQAGTFTFHQCFNESTAAITIDFGALGATAVHLLDFHGLVNFKNMAAGDTVHITGGGNITTETCTAGAIDYDGFFEYTDGGGNVTAQQSDIQVAVDSTLLDTAEIGTAGAGLTNINLPNQTMDIVGDITGDLSGSVGSVTGAVGSVTGAIGSLAAQAVTDILTTQMTEAYAANGAAPTLAQCQFAIHQMLMQFGIAGTSLTVRQLDDIATAFVVTLDSVSAPTDAKRV